VVCLCEIENRGRKLPCGHCFHSQCILDWWTHTPRAVLACPICKQQLPLQASPHVSVAVASNPEVAVHEQGSSGAYAEEEVGADGPPPSEVRDIAITARAIGYDEAQIMSV
jgi:hypothetical protein